MWFDVVYSNRDRAITGARRLHRAVVSGASVNRAVRYLCPVPTICERSSESGGSQGERRSVYGDVECELVEASVEPNGANPLGYVKIGSYIRLEGLSLRFTLRYKDGKYSLSHPEKAEGQSFTGGSLVFHADCVLKEVNFQVAESSSHSHGTIKSVNRSTTALDPGISDDFEADVDALVLADTRVSDPEWFSNWCAFNVLGLAQVHGRSYEKLGLGTWRFGNDEADGEWIKSTNCREFRVI